MLNTEHHIDSTNDNQQNVRQEIRSINFNSIKAYKGHTLYEVDVDNETVNIIRPERTVGRDSITGKMNKTYNKVHTKPNCLYISCLNKKNLIRIIISAGGQDITAYKFNI